MHPMHEPMPGTISGRTSVDAEVGTGDHAGMKTVEFWARVDAEGTLSVPAEVVAQIDQDEPFRVVLVLPDGGDDPAWVGLTADQFIRGYDPDDALYDDLPSG